MRKQTPRYRHVASSAPSQPSEPFPLVPACIRTPVEHLSVSQQGEWLEQMKTWLELKMRREQAYLERRRARGTRTPTDEAYERDRVYEEALHLFLLHELAARKEAGL